MVARLPAMRIFDHSVITQVLGDLMMCILFYDDQQEHKLKYKEKIHLILLYVLYGLLCIFDVYF